MRAIAAIAVFCAAALGLLLPAPWGDGPATTGGQMPVQASFAYQVLGGIGESRLSDGWHAGSGPPGGWTEGYALDFVGDYAAGQSVVGMKVHATFRHVSGVALTAKVSDEKLNCDGFRVELYAGSTRVATISYMHTDINPAIDLTTTALEWQLGTGQTTTSSGAAGNVGTHISTVTARETKCPQWWTGAHLHQRVLVHGKHNAQTSRDGTINSRGHADFADSNKWQVVAAGRLGELCFGTR